MTFAGTYWKYHALVSYHKELDEFIQLLEQELDRKRNIKLYIPERDMLFGAHKNEELARKADQRWEHVLAQPQILCAFLHFFSSYISTNLQQFTGLMHRNFVLCVAWKLWLARN